MVMHLFQRNLHRQKYGAVERPYQEQFYSRVFSGKDASGRPLQSHDHAYYLPTAENDARRIDHLTVCARDGFGPEEVAALSAARRLWRMDGDPLEIRLIGLGQLEDFRSPLFGPSRIWQAVTPFVVTRHVKKRGRKKDPPDCHGLAGRTHFVSRVLAEELDRWLGRHSGSAGTNSPTYTIHDCSENPAALRPLQFRRARRKPGDDGTSRPAAMFRVEFDREISGPLCLGHASHFGLGLFLPVP
jgi:CRISPR-associated protein Csb2